MVESLTTSGKKVVRRKSAPQSSQDFTSGLPVSFKTVKTILDIYDELIKRIEETKKDFEGLEKEIADTRQSWIREQDDRKKQLILKDQQETLLRKREEETYRYEITLKHKKEVDEFNEKRLKWEKELNERREELASEKQELELLRRQVANFDSEKNKVIEDACLKLRKELLSQYEIEKR